MWLHASDVSYDGAQAPQERAGARGGSSGGRVEPELTASELIHPPSAKRDRSSVILFAERRGEEGLRGRSLGRHWPMRAQGIGAAQQ